MGYLTRVEGELTITPPLTWEEIKESPFYEKGHHFGEAAELALVVNSSRQESRLGFFEVTTATTLTPRWEEAYKAYELMEQVQFAIDSHPGHTFAGTLHCEGEENADMWRVIIRDNRAVKVTPQITWPEA